MSVGILQFPGTNCDRDVAAALAHVGKRSQFLWYQDRFDVASFEALVIPGGFSYGDYLRCGALAARAPAMASVREAAQKQIPILGICNGFQILCEAQLLPGVLLRNATGRFVDRWVGLKLASPNRFFPSQEVLDLPVAHGEGRYSASSETLKRMRERGQIWLTYTDNFNGSVDAIAGVTNETGAVAALMPHPERAFVEWMGGTGGRSFFEGVMGK